jgi:hypothetical protein
MTTAKKTTKDAPAVPAVGIPIDRQVMPELPPASLLVECAQSWVDGWTEGQVRDYAAACVAAERERWLALRVAAQTVCQAFADNSDMQSGIDRIERVLDEWA